jgi:four helix bundle protein
MRAFDHRCMPVYRVAVAAAADVCGLAFRLPSRGRGLSDQAMRAASSIVLNIAEGAGEFPAREKARIYRIARRSAAETSAALDLLVASGLAREQDANPIQERLFEIGAMLTGLIKAQALRSPSKPSSRP